MLDTARVNSPISSEKGSHNQQHTLALVLSKAKHLAKSDFI